ncbi:hypothetical protein OV208_16800 [Corallococcus sp. bb12-1]|uniref:hypothetical protein n=1 Tax=Corallococcus sp. bb12-1 TaxID=2996784 RepID=UPI00226EF325|nr:hypothetical protein [Corallococcus sp. bb12-1]MCY1042981.1 hypothetical protein [Corallococcus sp. bb12-1]
MAGRPVDDSQRRKFLEVLIKNGGSSGNTSLMNELGWSESEYWRLREKLIEDGQILRGRGRGGSVNIVKEIKPSDTNAFSGSLVELPPEPEEGAEVDLYAPCLEVLHEKWTKERGLHDFHIEITANQGGKKTGGVWTRPDITAISMRTFTHWPGRTFDIWTFEIKPSWQFNITGVFEAAAHARTATHAFALFETPENPDDTDIARLTSEAQRMGVGLILFQEADDFETWDFMVEPVRKEPDPSLLEQFVVTQLSDTARAKLLRWSK